MVAVVQIVERASVRADGEISGEIGRGLYVLLGVRAGDTEADAEALAAKIVNLRIFPDENGKMNLSVKDISGDVLAVSNFTLLADYSHGNRPSYLGAAAPAPANSLYEKFTACVSELTGNVCQTGVFGADMKTDMVTAGPVTIIMDSEVLVKGGKRK